MKKKKQLQNTNPLSQASNKSEQKQQAPMPKKALKQNNQTNQKKQIVSNEEQKKDGELKNNPMKEQSKIKEEEQIKADKLLIKQGENQKEVEKFNEYLSNTGLSEAFKLIFAEILAKKIKYQQVYSYTAMRLRQIGNDLQNFELKLEKQPN